MRLKEERERQLEEYGQKVPGLKPFFNFWVPAITLISAWGVYLDAASWSGDSLGFILTLLITVAGGICFLFGRIWDKSCFVSSIVFLVLLGSVRIIDFIQVIAATASASQAASQVIADTTSGMGSVGDAAASIVATGVNFGTQFVMLGEIIALILFAILISAYLGIFIKHRKFFIA